MAVYTLYLESDLNRVFSRSLADVAAAELRLVVDRLLPEAIGPIEAQRSGRSHLLRFEAESADADGQLARVIGQLSASGPLFQGDPSGPDLMAPIPIDDNLVHGTELVTTQRYRGKTNERLTRAMLNVALATAGINPADPSGTVLDPLCGRGTTLNWALAYGLDTVGVEIDRSALDHHRTFVETWAKRARLPHKSVRHKPGNAEHRVLSMRLAHERSTLKASGGQSIETFNADGGEGGLAITKGSIDTLVADLPYGIQHRGHRTGSSGPSTGGERFDPVQLLERTLPTWHRWLKPQGGLCLAWNLKQAGRRAVSEALMAAGFTPLEPQGGHSMRHVVDASIDRDVITARPSE